MGKELEAGLRALSRLDQGTRELQAEVGVRGKTRFTVGIATYDDFDGAFFTVTSLLLHHAEAMEGGEIIILDNHPRGRESEALAGLARKAGSASVPVRYIPYEKVSSTAVRDVLFRHASGEIVIVLDTHVLLAPGAVRAILDYLEAPAHAADLVQGPMINDDGVTIASTQMDPRFSNSMFGVWGIDPRGSDPKGDAFDIPSQGLAAFAIRKESWPGINPRFRGFGGEEGYVHEKVRQRGGRTVCLPAFRWLHRFARPAGVPYEINYRDRLNNYLVGWIEIGYDLDPIYEHFESALGAAFAPLLEEVRAQVYAPLAAVDMTAVLISAGRVGPWIRAQESLSGIGRSARPFPWRGGPELSLGTALADVIEDAWERGSAGVLVIDEQMRLGNAELHALEAVLTAAGPGSLRVLGANGGGADVIVLRDLPSLHQHVDELRALHDPEEVYRLLDVEAIRPRVPIGDAPPLPSIAAGFVPEPYPGGSTGWLESYRGYAAMGWGTLVHGVRSARSRRHPATMRDLAVSKLGSADVEPGLMLFSEPGLCFLRGGAGVLARALEESRDREWDVMDLGALGGVELAPGDLAVGSLVGAPSSAAFLVNEAARERVAALLADGSDDVASTFASAAASGELRVIVAWPPVVARPDALYLADVPVGADAKYERHDA